VTGELHTKRQGSKLWCIHTSNFLEVIHANTPINGNPGFNQHNVMRVTHVMVYRVEFTATLLLTIFNQSISLFQATRPT